LLFAAVNNDSEAAKKRTLLKFFIFNKYLIYKPYDKLIHERFKDKHLFCYKVLALNTLFYLHFIIHKMNTEIYSTYKPGTAQKKIII